MEDAEVEGDGGDEHHVPGEVPARHEVGADVAEEDVHPPFVGDVAAGEEEVGEHGVEVAEQGPHERRRHRPAGAQRHRAHDEQRHRRADEEVGEPMEARVVASVGVKFLDSLLGRTRPKAPNLDAMLAVPGNTPPPANRASCGTP